jgi:hypothetical protein
MGAMVWIAPSSKVVAKLQERLLRLQHLILEEK